MKIRIMLIISMILLCATLAEAKILSKTVLYRHGDVALEGYLAYDDSIAGQRPAVLVVHEWWGMNDYARRRADDLAASGYVAFALDMYGKGKVTERPEEAGAWMKAVRSNLQLWQERALAGLEVLKSLPQADPARMAAIGYSFGGATVQQLAYAGADIKGVVSFYGSLIPAAADSSQTVKARILICHGAADPFVKENEIENYINAMEKSGLDWQMIVYGGAKHSFTDPDAGKKGMAALAYSPSADKRSWAHMKTFFDEIFAAN